MDGLLADVDLTHEQVVVNGVRLHAVTAGPADGDPVLCLHGFPEFWYSWRYQLPALVDAGYRVVAPDLRGYNDSEKPHGVAAYTEDELVADVAGLIRHYGGASAHVVGHDWGGIVAWALGYRRPEILDSLTVMNAPHPEAYARAFDLDQLRRSSYALFFQLPWLPERVLTAGDCRAIADLFREQPTNPDAFDEADVRRYRKAFCRPGAATSAINYYRAAGRTTALSLLKRLLPFTGQGTEPARDREVPVPTLVCWGEQDPALSVDLSEGLGEWIPDLRVERYPEASHWVQLDVPNRVNDALVGFLNEG